MSNDLDIEQGIPEYDFPLYTKKEIEGKLKEFIFNEDLDYNAFFQRFTIPLENYCEVTGTLKFKAPNLDDQTKALIKSKIIPPIFKNHFQDDFSLTPFGFATIIAVGLYPRVYSGKVKKADMLTPNTLILLKNFFISCWFSERSTIYYFDPCAHVEIKLYGTMQEFVAMRRKELG